MPVTLPQPEPDAAPVPAPNRVRWTRHQAAAIRDTEILTGRYELVDGEIISKRGQKPPHAYVIKLFLVWLTDLFGVENVQIQSTIDLAESSPEYDEPEPDAAVTVQPLTAYATHHPGPNDLRLVVEVSDTTLRFDLTTKARLYARAGITDYWVVDILGRRIIVHRNPTAQGYTEIIAYAENETLTPLARPDTSVLVADLLPPA